MPEGPSQPKHARNTSSRSHHRPPPPQKTEIKINVYDLLPPSRLSTILWALGTSLLHTGVIIRQREYAYGGHDRPDLTGVYYTSPGQLPPGATHRVTLLHGYTLLSEGGIEDAVKEASERFKGLQYNLLTRNCNHFTSYLVERLTGKKAPGWINRAAGIGVALPCVVPREWVAPPEYDAQDGHLLEGEGEGEGERAGMLSRQDSDGMRAGVEDGGTDGEDAAKGDARENGRVVKDSSGREIPGSERAPVGK